MKCRHCKEKFIPKFFNVKYCDKDECYEAMIAQVRIIQKKAKVNEEKKATKLLKDSLKTKSDYIKILQILINKYVRIRDKGNGCISCGRFNVEEFHAGHYVPTTYQYHRFNLNNIHLQCSYCNTHLRGNIIEYRKNLIKKIGLEEVEYLENSKHMNFELTITDLQELISIYKQKLKHEKNKN